MNRSRFAASSLLAILIASTNHLRADDERPLGALAGSWDEQRAAEDRAQAIPSPEKASAWLRTLTEEPHVAGTPADHATAVFVRDKLNEWGWDAELVEYEVLLNYPRSPESVRLELVRPEPRELPVREEAFTPDKDSASESAWPAFHGYGVSGDVTGQVVYANFGTPDDFDALATQGVSVEGKIVLVRYGGIFRGLKVLNAQRAGAIGVLIYSDPAEDGYARGDIYPRGPYRPPSAIQRGSVQFLSQSPGDPTTPGYASTKGVDRIPFDRFNGFPIAGVPSLQEGNRLLPTPPEAIEDWEEATGLDRASYFATIPSLPISYEAATPILEGLGGDDVPTEWQGGLPFAYHVGPGPVEVRFAITMDYDIRPIWNVIARIEGSVEPDRWVLIGNHRDAWTYGAVDPGSGTAATMEMCRAIGEVVKAGWTPRRTLVYASWDAEEYGLVGSTEWAEEFAAELDEKAVLMLNVDSAVAGPKLDVDGIPSLRDLVLEAAGHVDDPRTGKTLAESWVADRRKSWATAGPLDLDGTVWEDESSPERIVGPEEAFTPQMNYLGSGSDYTAFVDHLGIPAIDVNFTGRYGVYHSIYDDFYWMEQFGDPGFHLHALAARLYIRIAMRAAGADIVPLTFAPYGDALRDHVDELRRMLIRKRRGAEEPSQIDAERLQELIRAVIAFRVAAAVLDDGTEALTRVDVRPESLAELNDALIRVERSFLSEDGLPNRSWFRHAIYAPGLTLGYGAWPLPGPRQAIEEGDAAMFDAQLASLVERIDAATEQLQAAKVIVDQSIE